MHAGFIFPDHQEQALAVAEITGHSLRKFTIADLKRRTQIEVIQ